MALTKLEELKFAVNCAAMEAMDKTFCEFLPEFKRKTWILDRLLPKLLPALEATTEAALREAYDLMAETPLQSSGVGIKWTYCPECGCDQFKQAHDGERECSQCKQSWYADIDYTNTVRANLSERKSVLPPVEELVEALRKSRFFVEAEVERRGISDAEYDPTERAGPLLSEIEAALSNAKGGR